MEQVKPIIDSIAVFVVPLLIVLFPLYGLFKRVPVYEEFVEGAKEGFNVAIRIIPYLVAILFAIAMFRESGAMEFATNKLRPVLALVGFPPEVLPMAITRPLTGSGSVAVFADVARTHGEDSIFTRIAGTIFGSTETTFYVIAVYFGAVGVKKTRHAIAAGLIADLSAILLAVYICKWWWS